jgi:hypothetical protein
MIEIKHGAGRGADSRASEPLTSWVKPVLQRIEAGSAEAGANPQAPEGPFASGAPVVS